MGKNYAVPDYFSQVLSISQQVFISRIINMKGARGGANPSRYWVQEKGACD